MSEEHNRNPTGRNQYPDRLQAGDPVLKEALQKYHREGKTNNTEISQRLLAEYNITLSSGSVKRRRRDLDLYGSKVTTREMPHQEKVQLIIDELDKDISGSRGLDNIKARLAFLGFHLTRDFISDVMHEYEAEGFDHREPGAKKILRIAKNPIGIHERWAGDGHDKLYSIGFPIWAVVDDATSKWLGAWVVPSNRMGNIIGYLFLTLVEKYGGIPLQFTTDCGSETTQLFGLVSALREIFHPEYDHNVLPPHRYLRSVHNISIERSWLRLRLDWGNNAVLQFRRGEESGLYNSSDPNHHELCQWLWPKLLRQELEEFIEFRNGVRMRKDTRKAGPSGCSRNDAFSLYQKYGLSDCLLPIDNMDLIRELKTSMGGDAILEFVSAEFSDRAESAYATLAIEKLTMENVWVVFHELLSLVFP